MDNDVRAQAEKKIEMKKLQEQVSLARSRARALSLTHRLSREREVCSLSLFHTRTLTHTPSHTPLVLGMVHADTVLLMCPNVS
jgi:hypothetical protein